MLLDDGLRELVLADDIDRRDCVAAAREAAGVGDWDCCWAAAGREDGRAGGRGRLGGEIGGGSGWGGGRRGQEGHLGEGVE